MDVERYRKRLERELADVEPSTAPTTGRSLAAGRESAAEHAEAIRTTPIDEEHLVEQVADLLATVSDRKQPVTVRTAALQALAALDFLGPRFGPFRAEYKQVLRELATDPSRTLRASALETLAIEHDPYARDLLVRGLQQPDEALVSEARALQFLGYDDHAEIAPLARRVFRRSTGAAREEALRVLANDPKSEQMLTRLMKDKSEQSGIRHISASGLQSLNPHAFERTAKRIIADDGDYDEIRATSLAALTHGRESRDEPPDPAFVATVRRLTETTRSRAVRSSSARYLRATET